MGLLVDPLVGVPAPEVRSRRRAWYPAHWALNSQDFSSDTFAAILICTKRQVTFPLLGRSSLLPVLVSPLAKLKHPMRRQRFRTRLFSLHNIDSQLHSFARIELGCCRHNRVREIRPVSFLAKGTLMRLSCTAPTGFTKDAVSVVAFAADEPPDSRCFLFYAPT